MAEEISITLPDGQTYDQPTGLFINNEFVVSDKGEKFDSIDPFTGKSIALIYYATDVDVNNAVGAARRAFEGSWRNITGSERGKLLYKLAGLVEKDRILLAAIEAHDSGKPKWSNSLVDVDDVIEVFRYYAGWADKIHGKTIPIDENHLSYTIHEPLGVTAQIIPWNYPLDMLAWKVAPSLAAGNTVVLKSSELTPLSALVLARYFVNAGFPPGVVNILSGDGPNTGKPLASHPGINKVAFTGSTAVGKLIQSYAALNLIPVSMETGGKSPAIIFADADLPKTIKWAAMGIFYNSGQVCSATSRLLVHESILDKFTQQFVEYSQKAYRCGSPFEEEAAEQDVTVIGPQVSLKQQQKILYMIDEAVKQGAKVSLGGKNPDIDSLKAGYFVTPTILSNVTKDMTVFKEEVFGPVVTITSFSTDEEAVKLANDSKYGLGASVFTADIGKGHKIANQIQSGTIWINASNEAYCQIPFGGVKQSGYGRELGEYGLSLYTQAKSITVNWE